MNTSPTTLPQADRPTPPGTLFVSLTRSPASKIGMIVVLLLFMLIPLHYIGNVVQEREDRQQQVLGEFRTSWGRSQVLLGPILVVPYRVEPDKQRRFLHVAPAQLSLVAQLAPETRKRGLFHAVVYSGDVSLKGNFVLPSESVVSGDLDWHDSFIVMRATDLRGLTSIGAVNWNGQPLNWQACAESNEFACARNAFVMARVPASAMPSADEPISFETQLNLRGTQSFGIIPTGRTISIKMSAAWPTPSFYGAPLPSTDSVTASGFDALWSISSNDATSRWIWSSADPLEPNSDWRTGDNAPSDIGVELLEPVATYHMVERSSKYALLFLALSFVTYFLFEMIARIRIHLAQYGLLGLSISLFALLLISFSEPLGFGWGYLIATSLVLLQATIYTLSTTRRPKLATIFAVILAMLFAFLYIVLRLEALSLLVGSIALFIALSIIMAVTRRVDWFAMQGAVGIAPPSEKAAGGS